MVLEIAESILENSQLSEEDIRLELAITLTDKKGITLGQASELAGLELTIFIAILKERGVLYSTNKPRWQPLNLNIEKFPTNLDDFYIKPTQLVALSELFENEPSAEELCKML